ncbi:MAG TPA: hypothetical protein VGG25_30370 [Streptosporangiaceae bacterium]|jgi:hypothetical protein
MADTVLAQPGWRQQVAAALESTEIGQARAGIALAGQFGLDPVPAALAWLAREPGDGLCWQTVLAAADEAEAVRLVALAGDILPFASVPVGPADDTGMGSIFPLTHCLELILHRLRAFPGAGWPAIAIGLDCRVTRTQGRGAAHHRGLAQGIVAGRHRSANPRDGLARPGEASPRPRPRRGRRQVSRLTGQVPACETPQEGRRAAARLRTISEIS